MAAANKNLSLIKRLILFFLIVLSIVFIGYKLFDYYSEKAEEVVVRSIFSGYTNHLAVCKLNFGKYCKQLDPAISLDFDIGEYKGQIFLNATELKAYGISVNQADMPFIDDSTYKLLMFIKKDHGAVWAKKDSSNDVVAVPFEWVDRTKSTDTLLESN